MKLLKRYSGYPKTVIFFTGNKDQREDDKTYEWTKTAELLKVNSIFIMDDDFQWYHTCIDDIKEFLEDEVLGEKFTVGASSGGYAALLFGHIIDCPSLSFGPQTVLSVENKNRYKTEWFKRINNVIETTRYKEYLDLNFIKGKQHHIHYCGGHEHDSWFAERMDVTKEKHKCDKHHVGSYLKDKKYILPILEDFIRI